MKYIKIFMIMLIVFMISKPVYAQGIITGTQGGADCKNITIDSSGFDPVKHHVEVFWYDKSSNVLGSKTLEVNQKYSFNVPVQPAGIKYRVFDNDGNYVTPLTDKSSACVILTKGSAQIQVNAFDCFMNPIEVTVPFTLSTHYNWDTVGKYDALYSGEVISNTGAKFITDKMARTVIANVTYTLPANYKVLQEQNLSYTNTLNGLTTIDIQQTNCEAPTTEAPTTEAPTTEKPTTEVSATEKPSTEIQEKVVDHIKNENFVNDKHNVKDNELPDTGEVNNNVLLGSVMALLGGIFIGNSKRKENGSKESN